MAELLHQSVDLMSTLTPAQWCQTFFALSTVIILGIQVLPQDVRSALMDYGARRPKDAKHGKEREENRQKAFVPLRSFMRNLTEYGQVPHSWFLHFYIVSVTLSGFWMWQYLTKGHVLRSIVTWQDRDGGPSMSLEQVFVAWLLMALQGSRRLYESLFVFKPGSSPMWFIHWALGLSYYIAMSLAVWVEGSSTFSTYHTWLQQKLTSCRCHFSSLGFSPSASPSSTTAAFSSSIVFCGLFQAKPMPQTLGKPQEVYPSKRGMVQVYNLPTLHF
jgi:3-oxo-5-alpha-steroid 4-dehydrogenase 3